jgi:hypothetical protein
MTFSSWQGRSLDKDSRYVASGPAGQRVSVTPDAYERGRGFVTVLTWSSATTVTIDLSALGLRAGESYEIRDVQNLRASPVVRGTYQGTPVSVPLTASSTIAPIGGSAVTVTHTPRELMTFAVFRL